MIRGINQQEIFTDDGDYEKFLDILATYRKKIEYEIYAYCLMGNHVHLLIKEGKEAFSNTMKRIGTSYVYWYNWSSYREYTSKTKIVNIDFALSLFFDKKKDKAIEKFKRFNKESNKDQCLEITEKGKPYPTKR
ncbi:MAG: transposase [Candidatus Caldatribacteriota bacterium]|nr:transposase [Candidatus Caldatribacteriota bacterium]